MFCNKITLWLGVPVKSSYPIDLKVSDSQMTSFVAMQTTALSCFASQGLLTQLQQKPLQPMVVSSAPKEIRTNSQVSSQMIDPSEVSSTSNRLAVGDISCVKPTPASDIAEVQILLQFGETVTTDPPVSVRGLESQLLGHVQVSDTQNRIDPRLYSQNNVHLNHFCSRSFDSFNRYQCSHENGEKRENRDYWEKREFKEIQETGENEGNFSRNVKIKSEFPNNGLCYSQSSKSSFPKNYKNPEIKKCYNHAEQTKSYTDIKFGNPRPNHPYSPEPSIGNSGVFDSIDHNHTNITSCTLDDDPRKMTNAIVPVITQDDITSALEQDVFSQPRAEHRHSTKSSPVEDALIDTIKHIASTEKNQVLDLTDEQLCLKIARRLKTASFVSVLHRVESLIVPGFDNVHQK